MYKIGFSVVACNRSLFDLKNCEKQVVLLKPELFRPDHLAPGRALYTETNDGHVARTIDTCYSSDQIVRYILLLWLHVHATS